MTPSSIFEQFIVNYPLVITAVTATLTPIITVTTTYFRIKQQMSNITLEQRHLNSKISDLVQNLEKNTTGTKAEITDIRNQIREDNKQFRSDICSLRGEIKTDLGSLEQRLSSLITNKRDFIIIISSIPDK